MHKWVVAVAIVALLVPVAAEAQRGRGGGAARPMAGHGVEVPGWWARLDDPRQVGQGLKFAPAGAAALQLSASPAGIFWDPVMERSGQYTIRATFTQPKAQPTEAYGLFIGGSELAADGQRYTAFLVRPDGRFLIQTRQGAQMRNVGADWTEHAAIRRAEAGGQVSNELSIQVAGGTAVFMVNGQTVAKHPVSAISAEGNTGLRVNGRVAELRVEGFGVQ